jgi:hypothetical protein
MAQKNLMPPVAGSLNGTTTTGELPAELVEVSEEDLQQIVGGVGLGLDVDGDFEVVGVINPSAGGLRALLLAFDSQLPI